MFIFFRVDHLHHHRGGLLQHRGARREIDAFQVLGRQRIAVGELLDLLGDLVERRPQRFDVLALDGRDEAVHQGLADLVRRGALALAGQLEGVQRRLPVGHLHHVVKGLGAVVGSLRGVVEQGVELLAGAEDGLQREHWVHPAVTGGTATGRNYDRFMTASGKKPACPAAAGPGAGLRQRQRGVC